MSLKEDDFLVFMEAFSTKDASGAIRNQEARGQDKFVKSELLPTRCNFCTREQLEALGIIFGEPVEGDDLFIYVELPSGWKKVRTDHSMWSRLLDDQDRERALIFYKATFYDRRAEITLVNRFTYRTEPVGGYDAPDYDYDTTPIHCVVLDCGQVIWQSEPLENMANKDSEWFKKKDKLAEQGYQWLDEHYPEWNDPLAYWDLKNE